MLDSGIFEGFGKLMCCIGKQNVRDLKMATKPINARDVLPELPWCWVQANFQSRDYIPENKTGFCRG